MNSSSDQMNSARAGANPIGTDDDIDGTALQVNDEHQGKSVLPALSCRAIVKAIDAGGDNGTGVGYHGATSASVDTMTSIFLVGPMGSGKSTVGRALARKIGYRFIDSDREIEARCGVDIPTIFDYEGEAGFRDREARIIDELTRLPGLVLATGGGAVLREENRRHLMSRGHVILLQVDIKEQLRRVAFDANRPLLQTDDPEARLRALMLEREPIYKSVADVAISTDSRRMYHVVSRIVRHLKHQKVNLDPVSGKAGAEDESAAKPIEPLRQPATD